MQRYNCYHRHSISSTMPHLNGKPMWNGCVYANSPREALGKFKRLTPTAQTHYVVDCRAEGETR